jgi:pyrroline-5-carboxylate reductase
VIASERKAIEEGGHAQKTARNDAICTPEIEALLGEMRSTKEQGMDAYFAGSAPAYRALLVEAIACVHTAYSAGIPIR